MISRAVLASARSSADVLFDSMAQVLQSEPAGKRGLNLGDISKTFMAKLRGRWSRSYSHIRKCAIVEEVTRYLEGH